MSAIGALLILLLALPASAVNLGGTVDVRLRTAPVRAAMPGHVDLQTTGYKGGEICRSAASRSAAWSRYARRFGLEFVAMPVAHVAMHQCQVAGVRQASQAVSDLRRFVPNNIPDAGEAWLVALIITNNTMKYHGLGTSTTPAAETDTGCLTEVNSVYSTPNVRATGSLTTGVNTSQLLSAATTQLSATRTITEFCLLNQAAAPGGTCFTRTTFTGLVVTSSNFVDSTYRLTVE